MSNSKRFLDAFVAIENHLRKLARADRFKSASELVEAVGASNPAVRHHASDIREYADLRNAIVHERSDGHVIAEPNDAAVIAIERLAALVTKPPAVYPKFQAAVKLFQSSDSIASALDFMAQYSFSQVPIADQGRFVGLLTNNTIARWLGKKIVDDILSLAETQIADVMRFGEEPRNHAFLGKEATVYEAIGLFRDFEASGQRIDAILLTDHGRSTESILGLITTTDLPRAYDLINTPRR